LFLDGLTPIKKTGEKPAQGKRDYVTESTRRDDHPGAIVIQRENELSEFVELLEGFDVPVKIFSQGLPTLDQLGGAALVIVAGKRLVDSGTPHLSLWPRTIAVLDDSSKTLVSHLNRLGAAIVLRRPIHPRTLRLLLLHEIYRGPERRRKPRTLIGHPVRVTSGLFPHRATLVDLSSTGVRIDLAQPLKVGANVRVLLGRDLTLAKAIKLKVRVVRSISPSGTDRPQAEVGAAMLDPNQDSKAIGQLLQRFSSGPASWIGAMSTQHEPSASIESVTQATRSTGETLVPSESGGRLPPSFNPAALASSDGPLAPQTSPDRRANDRVPYDRRVVALGQEAARVLMGRDLSTTGMRVADNNSIQIGESFRLALHCGRQIEPLIIMATALRRDGDSGVVLAFSDLSSAQRAHLEKIIASNRPIHSIPDGIDPNELTGSVVVGEKLEKMDEASEEDSEEDGAGASETDEPG
jgi:hypothetical protein